MANYSQVDIISAESALRHFHDRWYAWTNSGGNPDGMVVDLIAAAEQPGGWQWNRFLMGRPWGEALFTEQVTSLLLVVRGGAPCLHITTAATPRVRHITWHGAKCRLSA